MFWGYLSHSNIFSTICSLSKGACEAADGYNSAKTFVTGEIEYKGNQLFQKLKFIYNDGASTRINVYSRINPKSHIINCSRYQHLAGYYFSTSGTVDKAALGHFFNGTSDSCFSFFAVRRFFLQTVATFDAILDQNFSFWLLNVILHCLRCCLR